MKYVLGLDQGSSKTHAMVADKSGNVLGLAKSRGVCHSSVSLEAAMDAVEEAADRALYQSGLTGSDITCVAAGLTGTDWDYEVKLLQDAVGRRLGIPRVRVVNDCIIAMRADSVSDVSGVICVGSGTNCAIRNRGDQFVYGFYIPDEQQGGMSLGRKTVQAVLDAHVGLSEQTALEQPVLRFFEVDTVDRLLYKRAMHQISGQDYLKLPILLEEAAVNGDAVSLKIWEDYGKTLASFVTARMKKMGMKEEKIEIILSGSIFKCRLPQFIRRVKEEILAYAPNAAVKSAVYEPIVGAVLLGLDELYQTEMLPKTVYKNLEASAERFPIRR